MSYWSDLSSEVNNDPLARGYSSKTPAQIIDSLYTKDRSVAVGPVDGWLVDDVIPGAEMAAWEGSVDAVAKSFYSTWRDLRSANRKIDVGAQKFQDGLNYLVDGVTPAIFTSATRTAINALQNYLVSRVDELDFYGKYGRKPTEYDVLKVKV